MVPVEVVKRFDLSLKEKGLTLEAIVIGGAALCLLGVVSRETRDCDILHPELSEEVRAAAVEFAKTSRAEGRKLDSDWLNNGPSSLVELLPEGWRGRLQLAFQGDALTLHALGRPDLLKTKLFAYCDRGTDLGDCLALAPTDAELQEALPWVQLQDAHPDWARHVAETLEDLGRRLGHGVS